jgi:flagellar export protein FliJ
VKKFRFKLARLETVRGLELDGLKLLVSQAEQAHQQALGELEAARAALEQSYDDLSRQRGAGLAAELLLSLESYSALLREQIKLAAERVIQREAELRAAREKLTAKHQEKRALEKLRERDRQMYSLSQQREEQGELDETAKNVHARKD